MTPVWEARRCTPTGSTDGRGGGPAGADAPQPLHLLRQPWVGAGAQQLAGVQVVEHQRGRLDPDTHSASAEDLRGQDDALAQRNTTATVDGAFHFDSVAVLDRRQW
jgi:hypothetical protein